MALKTAAEKPAENPSPPDTVLLELALYTQYTWGPTTYEKGTAYRFKREDAMILLAEQDHARPVWKMYQPPKVKTQTRAPVVDSTEVKAVRTRQTLEQAAASGPTPGKKIIEVGTDDEIADILNRPETDTSGDVTV